MYISMLSFYVGLALYITVSLWTLWEIRNLREDVAERVARPIDTSINDLVSIDERIALRESQYDTRIAEMKEKLANAVQVKHTPTHAQELHPEVKNLPHQLVDGKGNTLRGVEIAE